MQQVSTLLQQIFPNQQLDFEPNNTSISILQYALSSFKAINSSVLKNCENIRKHIINIQQQNELMQNQTTFTSDFNEIHRDLANAAAVLGIGTPFAAPIAQKFAQIEIEIYEKQLEKQNLTDAINKLQENLENIQKEVENAIQKGMLREKLQKSIAYARKVKAVLRQEIEDFEIQMIEGAKKVKMEE
ncbi:hypothetical protein SS50377_24250 [Spironucleus salmonicida]|uniref:Uncharacterized protein n=1 Tax=Spironucleus salmonicida TaxID=348837 RepID=A0A9P8RZ48_9EUKA|nr:hypothetical protein SS50377_24250 [Spironucleus salmonicida]